MKVIRANCRIQFTSQDIAFLLETLEQNPAQREAILGLFADTDTQGMLLDSEAIYDAIVENPNHLQISLHLFFYITVRRVLTKKGIDDENVADYVAELLTEFTRTHSGTTNQSSEGIGEPALDAWLNNLQDADSRTSFERKAYIANRLLFHTGIQEDWLRQRTNRRGAPSVEFYESVGPRFYRDAGRHRLAESYEVRDVFEQLADRFHETRVALNDLATRLLHLDDPAFPILQSSRATKDRNQDS